MFSSLHPLHTEHFLLASFRVFFTAISSSCISAARTLPPLLSGKHPTNCSSQTFQKVLGRILKCALGSFWRSPGEQLFLKATALWARFGHGRLHNSFIIIPCSQGHKEFNFQCYYVSQLYLVVSFSFPRLSRTVENPCNLFVLMFCC